MKGITSWGYRPYTLLNDRSVKSSLFVSRLCPESSGFTADYIDTEAHGHAVRFRKRGENEWHESVCSNAFAAVTGLEDFTDYEFCIVRTDGTGETCIRLVRTGEIPGTVINYVHPEDKVFAFSGSYPASPSVVLLPTGKLLASMDIYGPAQAQNLSLIYESTDGGRHWSYVTDLYPCFWGKLFFHKGKVYMLGMACEYGDLLIGSSDDEGHTWTAPVRLFNGSNARQIGPHKAPMPVICHEGRLYTGIDYGSWSYGGHDNCILSVDADADLMDSSNWHLTAPTAFDNSWNGLPAGTLNGCIEGNAIVGPDGIIRNILRLQQSKAEPPIGNAVMLRYTDPDKPLEFEKVIDFPLGASSKFVILKDAGLYIAIGSEAWNRYAPGARNVLSMAVSRDLINWKTVKQIEDKRDSDFRLNAFQYPDALIDGNDLIVLSRTAWNGANSYHDSNCITCYRIENYRSLCIL